MPDAGIMVVLALGVVIFGYGVKPIARVSKHVGKDVCKVVTLGMHCVKTKIPKSNPSCVSTPDGSCTKDSGN